LLHGKLLEYKTTNILPIGIFKSYLGLNYLDWLFMEKVDLYQGKLVIFDQSSVVILLVFEKHIPELKCN